MSKDIAKVVTDRIIDALKEGIVPWAKPWASVGGPMSVSGRRYRGINVLLLTLASMTENYTSPYWVTFNQAKKNGWTLKDAKGKGVKVVLYKPFSKTEKDENGKDVEKSLMMMRYFVVFNLDLVEVPEGCEVAKPEAPELNGDFDPIEAAQSVIDGMPKAPPISHNGDMAYYSPSKDQVVLPVQEAFDTSADYYAVAFHELAHATGHASRLDREGITTLDTTRGTIYAKEELVAELASAMLCGEAGLVPDYKRSAAYCKSWLTWAEDNRRAIISAAGQAQKAADFILGTEYENGTE
jgi:antirestriction protein ArdC